MDLSVLASHNLSKLLDMGNGGNSAKVFSEPTKAHLKDVRWCSEWRYSGYKLGKDAAEFFLDVMRSLIKLLKDHSTNNKIKIDELKPYK